LKKENYERYDPEPSEEAHKYSVRFFTLFSFLVFRPKPTSKEWKLLIKYFNTIVISGPKPTSKEWKLIISESFGNIPIMSEAYLEGMKTFIVDIGISQFFLSEAYLEGMKTF